MMTMEQTQANVIDANAMIWFSHQIVATADDAKQKQQNKETYTILLSVHFAI